jgi:hypothetical protein
MQEIYQVTSRPVAGFASHADELFEDTGAVDAVIRKRIAEARAMARAGDVRAARTLCADIVLEHQLRLHDDRGLLREAVGALIRAHAFQMLSRLLLSVDGRRIRVAVAGTAFAAGGLPALIRRSDEGGAELYSVEEKLFQDPSCDAIIDRWSEGLIERGYKSTETAVV